MTDSRIEKWQRLYEERIRPEVLAMHHHRAVFRKVTEIADNNEDLPESLDDLDKCEYLVPIDWIKTVPREQHFWKPDLFANQNTAARLRDTETIARVEQHFGISADGDESAA
jgi:hypothetical protein